jgi:hypothetical protein
MLRPGHLLHHRSGRKVLTSLFALQISLVRSLVFQPRLASLINAFNASNMNAHFGKRNPRI